MPTLTLIIQAVDDADLSTRLSNISDQIKQGYGGAQGKTDAGVFKYLIKDTVKGSEAQLPRIPTSGIAQSEEADENPNGVDLQQDADDYAKHLEGLSTTAPAESDETHDAIPDEDDQDTAGVAPISPIQLGHPLVGQAIRNASAQGVGVALPTVPVAAQQAA